MKSVFLRRVILLVGRKKAILIKLPVLSTFYIYDEDEISEWYGVYGSFWEDRER